MQFDIHLLNPENASDSNCVLETSNSFWVQEQTAYTIKFNWKLLCVVIRYVRSPFNIPSVHHMIWPCLCDGTVTTTITISGWNLYHEKMTNFWNNNQQHHHRIKSPSNSANSHSLEWMDSKYYERTNDKKKETVTIFNIHYHIEPHANGVNYIITRLFLCFCNRASLGAEDGFNWTSSIWWRRDLWIMANTRRSPQCDS